MVTRQARQTELTTAERTASGATPAPLRLGPMLVLTGSNDAQEGSFHDGIQAGADFIASDQYEPLARVRAEALGDRAGKTSAAAR